VLIKYFKGPLKKDISTIPFSSRSIWRDGPFNNSTSLLIIISFNVYRSKLALTKQQISAGV
jgi:hypothetical protein